MAGLSVIFKAIDEISDKFEAMSSAGSRTLDAFDKISDTADKAMAKATSETQKITDAMQRATSATDFWTDAVGNYDKGALEAVYSTEELVNMGFKTEEALTAEAEAAQLAQNNTSQMGDAMDRAAQDSDRLQRGLDNADRSTDELTDGLEQAGKEAKDFGDKSKEAALTLDDVLKTIGVVAALKAIANAFLEASDAAAKFETSVAMVSTVADTTILSSDQLSAQISQLSRDTAKDVNELADATYNAISAGVATEDAVSTVGDATKLATAGFTSSSSALSVLTTALNAYQLEASEVTNISDSLITSQNLGVMTIDQLSSSMGKAISTASAYNIDLYNLESGYISLTKAGVSVEESTTYLSSMFNELGKSSSDVSKILVEETGQSFGELMQSGYTLADVLEILYNSADQNSEALMNMWGSAEAGKAANAVINQGLATFNSNLDKLRNSAGTTEKAYAAMTDTSTYATERLENSMNNLNIAIGDNLNPTFNKLKNGMADITDGAAKIIAKNPAITGLLTGVTVALAALTVGITAHTAVTKIATVATAAFTAVMDANPIFLAVTAVAALTAGFVAFVAVVGNATDDYENLTYATRQQKAELEDLTEQYESACDTYGETSEEALRLRYQMDELSDSVRENGQSMEDFLAECDEVIESSRNMVQEYDDSMKALHNTDIGTQALILRLEDLANSTDHSAGKQMEMEAIIAELNSTIDGLNLSYGDLINNQSAAISSLRAYAEAQSRHEKMQAQYDSYVQSISEEASIREELTKVTDELSSAQEQLNTASQEYEDYLLTITKYDTTGFAAMGAMWSSQGKAYDEAKDNVDALTEREEELNQQLEEQLQIQSECETAWEELAQAQQEAIEASDGFNEASQTISDYQERIEELCKNYDAAYDSAYSSITGQYKLWEDADEIVATSAANIEKALQSQLDYWTSYNDNMASLTARTGDIEGLDTMLAALSDGSAESANMIAGMKDLDDATLTSVVQQFTDLREAQSETATSIADLQTDFAEQLGQIQTDMEETIENLNLSDEAKTNAKATMDAYVQEIEDGVARAQRAINSLSFANDKLGSGGFHEYAVGTVSAEPGLALVGEEGPELVNFGGGEVVYTADETADILAKDTADNNFYVAPEQSNEVVGSGDKTITLKVEGAGEMKVTGNGVSKEDVVNLLMGNLKDALMGIIKQEIDEEGVLSYEF